MKLRMLKVIAVAFLLLLSNITHAELILITWEKSIEADVVRYHVYVSHFANGPYEFLQETDVHGAKIIMDDFPEGSIYFRVKSVSLSRGESSFGNIIPYYVYRENPRPPMGGYVYQIVEKFNGGD